MNQGAFHDALALLADATRDAPLPLGRYDVVGRLGRGGMGTVYEAIDHQRNTKVAVEAELRICRQAAEQLSGRVAALV